MRTSFSTRRLVRHTLAILFAACASTYSVLWIIQQKYVRPQPGFTNYEYSPATHSMTVGEVERGSRAEAAGLHPGDHIVAIDGQTLDTLRPFYEAIIAGQKDVVDLTVEPPTSPAEQRRVKLALGTGSPVPGRTMQPKDLLSLPLDYYPLGFLLVGLAVLTLRPDDANAWLLALLFGGFLAAAPLFEGNFPVRLRGFVVCYKIIAFWSSLALFYYFFAVFPASSPVDRKVPWLKYLLLAAALVTTVPIAFRCLLAGGSLPLYLGMHWPGTTALTWFLAVQTGLPAPAAHGWPNPAVVYLGFFIGATVLGLSSLISNDFLAADPQVRRKAHVMVWGTVIGVAPICLVSGTTFLAGLPHLPMALWQVSVLLLSFLWPLSFAYAVVKHRVLEIPVLLKRSARYLLVQRGYFVVLFVAAAMAIALFTHTISRFFPEGANIGMAASAVFGIVLVWMSAPMVKRGTEQIDRAFFRSAYDARVILQDLAEKARSVTDRRELANLLEMKIAGALHPKSLACYLETGDGNFVAARRAGHLDSDAIPAALPRPMFPLRFGAMFVPKEMDTVPATLPLLGEIAKHGKAWDVPQVVETSADPAALAPECLVPILGRNSRLIGLLVLGQRFSEEPYSREDKQLLDSVASQAGITLENIRLAETMAERMEAERRAAMEMDIARRVQARLFPQKLPPLKTLDYVGGCLQARQVGGDYYDFLDMGPEAMGIVLADISGKGISGALLMANLQANLRSQYAVALDDLPRLLQSVNRLFYDNTTDESYATMFFGVYEDSCRTMRFANCGHVPPLILRADGSIERLASTTTVIGLFLEWQSRIDEVRLCPGDLLVIYSDGVSEAPNAQGEEYGQARLANRMQENREAPVSELLAAIQASVQEFSGATQADDITLIVARCR
jgi:serine phosphatase RsbU (regulator of sigma subunit)